LCYFATLAFVLDETRRTRHLPSMPLKIPFGPCVDCNPLHAVPGMLVETGGPRTIGFSYERLRRCQVTTQGLVLLFSSHRVTVQGRRLQFLAGLIDKRRVARIRPAPGDADASRESLHPWITEIVVEILSDSKM